MPDTDAARVAGGWTVAPAEAPDRTPDPLARAIGRAIADHRRARGMTQRDLARAVGCGPSAIARWEAGTRTPQLARLVAVARALDCSIDRLLPPDG